MQQYLQNKKGLVEKVFDKVYDQYDLMNDFMSLGIHRLWKRDLLNMMNPSTNQKLIFYTHIIISLKYIMRYLSILAHYI